MSEVPTKLDALGELLGVEDDTRELERPVARRPAVGEVLRGETPAEPTTQPAPPKIAAGRQPPREQSGVRASADRPARQSRAGGEPVEGSGSSARSRPGRHRTSASLPVELVERLLEAKRRRWELSDLVVRALDDVDLDPVRADAILSEFWNGTRVQRAYQLAADDIARIDAVGERWRMNRSQVLTAILPGELERLGL